MAEDARVLGRVVYEDEGCVVLAKDPDGEAELFGDDVITISYHNVDDREDVQRDHDFREGVALVALPGGMAVLMVRERGRIWEDFEL